MLKARLLRYVFLTLWYGLVPIALAFGTLQLLTTDDPTVGPVLTFVREQRIPAGIVLFTLFEMAIYYFRHHLPFAEHLGPESRSDVPKHMRREFEAAEHLVDESDRLLKKRRKAIDRALPEAARDEVHRRLQALRTTMTKPKFDENEFGDAFAAASDIVDKHLSSWRKGELREYVESIGIAILVALMLRAVVVEAFKIPSGSMLPTLQIGDHIFVNKFVYGPTLPFFNTRVMESLPPHRGDVIVFEYPDPSHRERQDFIKRVIALPGDTLEVEEGHPILNGWRVPNCEVGNYEFEEGHHGQLFVEYLSEHAYLTVFEERTLQRAKKEGPFHVKPGELWVMGDNRHNSLDSRAWRDRRGDGVPYANIKGRAMFVWLPLDRMLVNVNGRPTLPKGAPADLTAGIEKCLQHRPPLSETSPPAPQP